MKERNCIFTICAKNYIGLAEVLRDSIKAYYSNFDFYIFIADELPPELLGRTDFLEIKGLDLLSTEKWTECSFKYTVTEFCTLLKPFVFKYLFANYDYERICYFDPDIAFYSSCEFLFDNLEKSLIELTPHFLTQPDTDVSKHFEDEVRFSGIFNLGFLGLRRADKTLKMLNWWGNNLEDKGFADFPTYQFTDQKWMDFMPVFFQGEELCVLTHMGCNIAPWNYFERKISIDEKEFLCATDRNTSSNNVVPVIFVHYSGFNYKKFMEGTIIQNNEGHDEFYEDINILFKLYEDLINSKKREILVYLDYSYSYNYFDNGDLISSFSRRLYRALLDMKIDAYLNPFNATGEFYHALKKRKLLSNNSVDSSVKELKSQSDKMQKKIKVVNNFFLAIYKALGVNKYLILMRFLRKYSIQENQLFLLDKKLFHW